MKTQHGHACPSCGWGWEHKADRCGLKEDATCTSCLEILAMEFPKVKVLTPAAGRDAA